jgi:hypothetical protein
MESDDLQSLCATGQRQLVEMDYLAAEATLVRAEELALAHRDFDTLSRLYMPLQEARRQRRQRCGEGIVRLDLLARSSSEQPDPGAIVDSYPHGQLLVAGWGSIEPALRVRQLQSARGLYLETYLGAVYPIGAGRAVLLVPLADMRLPDPSEIGSIDELVRKIPAHCVVLSESELPQGALRADTKTFAFTMSLWEKLHAPFFASADAEVDPLRKIEGYRRAIRVDYACELAHQKLADVARALVSRA